MNHAASDDLILREALERCEQADGTTIEHLFADLSNVSFLLKLDGPRPYEQRQPPPHLQAVLTCVARRGDLASAADGLARLADLPEYSPGNLEGGLRRYTLIRAAGHAALPSSRLVQFLDGEVARSDGRYRSPAVRALAGMGTRESAAVLWSRVFNSQSSVVPEGLRDTYEVNYAIRVGEHRDRLANLTLMLDALYATGIRHTVTRCLVEDVVKRGPDPKREVVLAALNADTPGAVSLAHKLATWLPARAAQLAAKGELEAIAKRILDLLGVSHALPGSGDADAVKEWARAVFEQARDAASDPSRKAEIQTDLDGLR